MIIIVYFTYTGGVSVESSRREVGLLPGYKIIEPHFSSLKNLVNESETSRSYSTLRRKKKRINLLLPKIQIFK